MQCPRAKTCGRWLPPMQGLKTNRGRSQPTSSTEWQRGVRLLSACGRHSHLPRFLSQLTPLHLALRRLVSACCHPWRSCNHRTMRQERPRPRHLHQRAFHATGAPPALVTSGFVSSSKRCCASRTDYEWPTVRSCSPTRPRVLSTSSNSFATRVRSMLTVMVCL